MCVYSRQECVSMGGMISEKCGIEKDMISEKYCLEHAGY